MVKKTTEQKKVINNLEKFFNSRKEVINFFRDYIEMLSDANYDVKQNKTTGIRQIVYYLYQSRQITKKVYNSIIKSI